MELVLPEMAEMKRSVEDLTNVFVNLLVKTNTKATVTAADIAKIEGVSVSQLRRGGRERYLLPRFGESAYPTGTPRWSIEEYMEWRKKDPEERNRAYLAWLRRQVVKNSNNKQEIRR